MDYIQEELRRQWEALAALLPGGGPRLIPENGQGEGPLSTGRLSAGSPPSGSLFSGSPFAGFPAAEQTAAGPVPGPADTQRPRFAAGNAAAMEGNSPPVPGSGPARAGTVTPREEAVTPAAEIGGPVLAALGERDRADSSPAEAKTPAGEWNTAETGLLTAWRSRENAAAERTVTEFIYPAGGGTAGTTGTAEILSRAFQRDARRYDGGFTLY